MRLYSKAQEQVPEELTAREQWVCWCYENRNGELAKVPHIAQSGRRRRAATDNPNTWRSFDEAVAACESEGYDGIGYVFSRDDPYTGVDLDNCRDPESGELEQWAAVIVAELGGYCEASPSREGVHIIVRGRAPNRRRGSVELYSSGRFFTVTGQLIAQPSPTGDIPDRQEALDEFAGTHLPPRESAGYATPTVPAPTNLDAAELLDKARNARNGEEFKQLFDRGDLSAFDGDHSRADFRLAQILAFWTGKDEAQIERLFSTSALGQREKWRRRAGYRASTIRASIAATTRVYSEPAPKASDLAKAAAQLRALAASLAWEGRGGPTDCAVFGAVVDILERYGSPSSTGVVVAADARNVALRAGVSLPTAAKSLRRLQEDRKLLRRIRGGKGTRAATYLLKTPAQGLYTKQCALYVQPLSALRNRVPKPKNEFDKNGRRLPVQREYLLERVGKLSALILERVGDSGDGTTLPELAASLDRRVRNITRQVNALIDAGLLAENGGRLALPADFAHRLEVELEESGCNDARKRDARRYREEREAFRSRKERLADDAPSDEDMHQAQLQRTQDALDILQTKGTGPSMILQSYLSGETENFEYVVNAVAFYYGGANPDLWRKPVEQAVELVGRQPL